MSKNKGLLQIKTSPNNKNKNGIQDENEVGIKGVTIKLYNAKGKLVAVTSTNENGLYKFTKLQKSEYYIEFIKPEGYIFSINKVGTNLNKDSDADKITGKTEVIKLQQDNFNYDAGLYKKESTPKSKIPNDKKPKTTDPQDKINLPKTGEESPIWYYTIGICLMALGLFIKKNGKKTNDN